MSCTIKNGKYFAPNGEESILYKSLRENVSEEEAHSLFIQSKTPTFKTDVEIPLIQAHRNKVVEIPENIKFKETFANKIRTFHIYNGKAKVGRIQLTAYKDGFKVKSALVSEKQRGKGYGKYLYNYAVSRLLAENSNLYTDTARTEDADKVWESLKRQGLSQDGKSVKVLPEQFDKNGEIKAPILLEYVENNFSASTPLTAVEKSHLINVNIPNVETSDDLYRTLYEAFYKDNLFSPNLNKLKKIYSEEEIRNILEDAEIQGRVRDTIERLRHTEEFTIPQINYNKDFDYRSAKVNIIGQFKKENPLKLEQKFKEQDYTKIPVIDESGKQLETQLFYENAIKEPSKKVERALQAVVGAHPMVDTAKIENSIIKAFKNYGMDIEGLERENFKELLAYVDNPSQKTRIPLEDVLGFVREPLTKPINISPENRSYQYLKTAKSEQELFDEMSLIQTTTPNVYHKINKIDEQEMRDIQENQDLTIPEYQLYKDYYRYTMTEKGKEVQTNIQTDTEYLTNGFIADFATEKLKNPTEFNRQFKVTENGLELVSNDIITLETIKAYIKDNTKYAKEIADYSLISKDIPNLKEKDSFYVESLEDKRAQAVNNPNSVNRPTTEVTILDEESIAAPNETSPFIRINNDVYEMQEAGFYNKLEKNDSPIYFTFPKTPEFKSFDLKQAESAETKTKKLTDKKTDSENFGCL